MLMRRFLTIALFWGSALAGAAQAIEIVNLPATPRRPALTLHWAPLGDARARPVVVALHGCGGLFGRDGRLLEARYPGYVERLHALGFHVLLPDSFGSRGLGSLCTQPYGARSVTIADRRADVLDALAWLQTQPRVDVDRIALLGWSNGASTALSVIDATQAPPAPPLAAAVLFYPGCGPFRSAEPAARAVLMQLGADDDWTPPAPCVALARRWQSEWREVGLDVYAGAYHGFDSDNPVRYRGDVGNGRNPAGVHLGGNPEAFRASQARLAEFLAARLGGGGESPPANAKPTP